MNLLKILSFVKTAECGSFTKAPELLNYSQSSISRMINDLEKEWNVVLLERGTGGVKLTSDGIELLKAAKKVINEYDHLQLTIDELNGLKSGLIRIGTFSSVATHWLPNIIQAFQNDYPNIEYELLLGDYTEIEDWIAEGRVDFGFLSLPTCPDFETLPLAQDKLVVILPEDHELAEIDKFPVKTLENYPFIMLEKGADNEISEIFKQYSVTPRIRFTTWDDYAIMSMVEKGLGISILPELILKRIPYNIKIKELDVPAYRNIGLAMRSRQTAPRAVQYFLEYLNYR